jgi:hypothetical protein
VNVHVIEVKYESWCRSCRGRLPAGSWASWQRVEGVTCPGCRVAALAARKPELEAKVSELIEKHGDPTDSYVGWPFRKVGQDYPGWLVELYSVEAELDAVREELETYELLELAEKNRSFRLDNAKRGVGG